MNKKGLTFIQFAGAVIVLGLIVILLWPQYEKVIEKSRYNTFVNATKQLLNNTNTSYMKYSKAHYSNVITGQARLVLDKKGYQYIITVNKSGVPTEFYVTDGKYKVQGADPDGIKVDKVGEDYPVEFKENVKYKLLENSTFEEITED